MLNLKVEKKHSFNTRFGVNLKHEEIICIFTVLLRKANVELRARSYFYLLPKKKTEKKMNKFALCPSK